MVQVCVVANNQWFVSHLSGEVLCPLVQGVGQVHCLCNYRYIFSIDGQRVFKCILKCTYLYFGSMSYSRIVSDVNFN